MAGFNLVKDPDDTGFEEVTISSLTLAVGDMLELDAGATAWTVADASTQHWQKKVIVVEPATSSDTLVKVLPVSNRMTFKVDVANNSSSNHDGDRMLLTDKNTVNNSGTDSTAQEAVFIQDRPVGSASDKTVLGKFVAGTGVDPDAA